tara:strand:+ start:3336 stop:3647 length:312 start_codon:yes stop_codon:yes gene_type:complete
MVLLHTAAGGVGAALYEGSLSCITRFATYENFGAVSGYIPPVHGTTQAEKALFFSTPGLAPQTPTRDLTLEITKVLFDAVRKGLKVEINKHYILCDAPEVHIS